jgi:hypothetical protein
VTQTASKKKLIWRILAWLCAAVISFVAAFLVVDYTGNLALSAGLYGTPGTYKVDSCYDTNPSRKNSDHECEGTFTPHGDPDGASYAYLDDATDYRDGEEVEMRQGLEWDTYQATGFWPAMGEIWKVGLSLSVLAFCAAWAVDPGTTNSQRRPDTSWRDKAAGYLAVVGLAGVATAVLDAVVALVTWLVGLAI